MPTGSAPTREGELLAKKYKLEKLLGAGGMGEVYRARNVLIDRTVAIKLLRPELATNADVVTRFMREARAANVARHPNIVDVVDVGQDDNAAPFIVQEYLEGHDLGRHLEEAGGRLSLESVLTLVTPIVEAVGFAHSKGVVHRDLKPENVFIARVDGGVVPKVLDFGISKLEGTPADRRMTATGAAMGTPAYMSPEQIQGKSDLDARADVWAIGVMLFELLAGRLPFDEESQGALFVQICTEAPTPLDQLAPSLPSDVVAIVMRCLRRDRTQRYPTASEVARDMRLVRDASPIEPTQRLAAVTAATTPRAVAIGTQPIALVPRAAAKREAPTLDASPAPIAPPSIAPEGTLAEQRAKRSRARIERHGERELEVALVDRPTSRMRPAARGSHDPGVAEARRGASHPSPSQAALVFLVLGGIALAAALAAGPTRASFAGYLARWLDHTPPVTLGVIAVSLLVAAATAGLRGLRIFPTSRGHLMVALGLLAVDWFIGASALATLAPGVVGIDTARAFVPRVLPVALALVPFGIGVWASRRATDSWSRVASTGKLFAMLFANLGVLAFYAAIQCGRDAVDPRSPTPTDEVTSEATPSRAEPRSAPTVTLPSAPTAVPVVPPLARPAVQRSGTRAHGR